MRNHGAISPSLRMIAIDLQHFVQRLFRQAIFLGIDGVIGKQQQRGNVPGVGLQSPLQQRRRLFRLAIAQRNRQAEQKIRVFPKAVQTFLKRSAGHRKILFVQCQISRRQNGLPHRRIRLPSGIEKELKHPARLLPKNQRRLAQSH